MAAVTRRNNAENLEWGPNGTFLPPGAKVKVVRLCHEEVKAFAARDRLTTAPSKDDREAHDQVKAVRKGSRKGKRRVQTRARRQAPVIANRSSDLGSSEPGRENIKRALVHQNSRTLIIAWSKKKDYAHLLNATQGAAAASKSSTTGAPTLRELLLRKLDAAGPEKRAELSKKKLEELREMPLDQFWVDLKERKPKKVVEDLSEVEI